MCTYKGTRFWTLKKKEFMLSEQFLFLIIFFYLYSLKLVDIGPNGSTIMYLAVPCVWENYVSKIIDMTQADIII